MGFDLRGAGGGAASGAMLGSAFGPIGTGIGAVGGGVLGALMGGKKKKGNLFDYQRYSGPTPPQPQYLRPVEDQLYNILMQRSRGEDVGYSPEWMTKNTDLIKSQLGRQQEDQLRTAQGQLASSGLSGNPRAYEALAGRVQRDTSRTLGEELGKISIADLEKRNQERDVNTGRLQGFNTFNFGQANQAANFGLDTYNAEQGNRLNATRFNTESELANQNQGNEMFSDLLNAGIGGASLFMGGGGPSVSALSKSTGMGIQPNYLSPINTSAGQGFRKFSTARNLVR